MSKKDEKMMALKRIDYLFNLIENNICEFESAKTITSIRTKYNIRLNKEQKQVFCKKCFNTLKQGKIRFKKIKKNNQEYLQKICVCKNEHINKFTLSKI